MNTQRRSALSLPAVVLAVSATLCSTQVAAQDTDRLTVEFETTEITAPDVAVSRDGRWLIVTMLGHLFRLPKEGGQAEQLTFGPYYDTEPAISPDGERVAFVSDRDGSEGNLFLLELATGEISQVTHEYWAGKPVWSPDGETIGYLSYAIEHWNPSMPSVPAVVRRVSRTGGEPDRITSEAAPGLWLFYLPDGRLGWTRPAIDQPDGAPPTFVTRLLVTDPEGAVDTLLSLDGIVWHVLPVEEPPGLIYHRGLFRPSREGWGVHSWIYSPLTRESERLITILPILSSHNPRVGVTPDGGHLFFGESGRLWNYNLRDGDQGFVPFSATVKLDVHAPVQPPKRKLRTARDVVRPRRITEPRLSPDGRLVFGAAGYIWQQLPGDSAARRVFVGSSLERTPELSPDGRKLAYVPCEHGRCEIRVFDFESGQESRVADGDQRILSWTPDGQRLLFDRAGRVVAVSVEDGSEQFLGSSLGSYWLKRPHLSGDGTILYVSANITGVGSLYRQRLDGNGAPEAITDFTRHLSEGVVSPDGGWLVFRRNTEIWAAPLREDVVEDKDTRRLSDAGGDGFALTPDGSAVIYAVGHRVWRQPLAGGAREEIPVRLEFELPTPPTLLVQQLRLLDFTAGSFSAPTSVLVVDGRVRGIGEEADRLAPPNAVVVDAGGRFAIPGLFDAHVHLGRGSMNEAFLAYGVTSVRDCGVWLSWLQNLDDRSDVSTDPFPRFFYSGGQFIDAQPRRSDIDLLLHDPDEAAAYVRRWYEHGVDFLKVYPQGYELDGARPWWMFRAVAAEARRLGMPLAGHGTTIEEVVKSVTLGFTVLEHAFASYDDVHQLLAAAGTRLDPTLSTSFGTAVLLHDEPERLADPKLRAFVPGEAVETGAAFYPWADWNALRTYSAGKTAMAAGSYQRGAQILAGTDVMLNARDDQAFAGVALHWELEHLVDAGIPPLEVLRIATQGAAVAVGAADDLGTLDVGKLADIVLLAANPLEDIKNTQTIWRVIKGGWVFDPEELAVRRTEN
jgi:imidazolonepropionase-like amidohydrolase/Tol biopolymer transport system component